MNNPFKYSDFVMTTTHKILGGPRGAIIFCRKKYQNKIDFSGFIMHKYIIRTNYQIKYNYNII